MEPHFLAEVTSSYEFHTAACNKQFPQSQRLAAKYPITALKRMVLNRAYGTKDYFTRQVVVKTSSLVSIVVDNRRNAEENVTEQ